MPFYQRLGSSREAAHPVRDNGTLVTEEVMGMEGFVGMESILYHLQSPCRVMKVGDFEELERKEWVPDTHAHRHFKTYGRRLRRATRSPGVGC
jgi:homogentisate 1,2-dioxygenase